MCRYRVPLGGGHDPAAGLTTEEERYARLAYNIHMPEVYYLQYLQHIVDALYKILYKCIVVSKKFAYFANFQGRAFLYRLPAR